MKKLKQILSNKNTVTFIGIILIVLVLYFFYNWRLNSAMTYIEIPYAVQSIAARTKITSDMIGTARVTQDSLKGNVITSSEKLINRTGNSDDDMYVNVNTSIPAGSFFYKEQVVTKKELPDSFLINIKEGYVPYNFSVNIESTYGNSMYPGNYVDVYFKGIDNNGLIMVGKLVENVEILAVKDSGGRHVFETTSEERSPSQIIFGVTNDIHLLLRKAEYIRDAEIILVPTNASLQLEDEEIVINVTNTTIREFIEAHAIDVSEEE